jgi:hypothetical protein
MMDVLRVPADGTSAKWLGLEFEAPARKIGLFALPNAGPEGLGFLPRGRGLLIAAEREPRGLIELASPLNGESRVTAWLASKSILPLPEGRLPDYSDLSLFRGRVFAISRNAEAIVELLPASPEAGWKEVAAWSYRDAARSPAAAYRHDKFGMAEGFAISGESLWLIYDNNRSFRLDGSLDRRPILMEFDRPETMK